MSSYLSRADIARRVDELNHTYEQLHTRKEDAFWTSYMNLAADADQAKDSFVEAELAIKGWMADPHHVTLVRELRAGWHSLASQETALTADDRATEIALEGWERTFAANVIESAEARRVNEEIIAAEAQLARDRDKMPLGYQATGKPFEAASSIKLAGMLRSEPNESLREAAWKGLRSIETYVLEHGFLDIVKQRNRLARLCGASDFYAWKVQLTEGMSKAEVFDLLNALEAKTRASGEAAIRAMNETLPGTTVRPWNALYAISGDLTQAMDPYFPFAKSLLRWGQSFTGMGVKYHGAELKLDLLDRKGKYENGFMHGPVPAWRKHGHLRPARIHFTTNAIPTQVGAGQRSMETFMHEGGHAAHFANIDMPSPCFAQEFAPTSVAFAEIQSIFMDNLMRDADWLRTYAATNSGEAIPMELIERSIRLHQPFAAWQYRVWLIVPFFEKALYEMSDAELEPNHVLKVARQIERELGFMSEGSHRPVLSIPHLLSVESSAYYHGYVLAQMGVDQTRAWFANRELRITDNPEVGPLLAERYWRPGNRYTLHTFLERFTGSPLSEAEMAKRVNLDADATVAVAHRQAEQIHQSSEPSGVELDATVTVVDGNEIVTSTSNQSFEDAASEFADWIKNR